MNDPLLPPILKKRDLVHDKFFKVWEDQLHFGKAGLHNFYIVELRPVAVMVVARTREGLFVVNREYRHPTGQFVLGCPGGGIDNVESPLEAAERELLEETGYSAESFKVIGKNYPFPGITGQELYYVLAEGAYKKSSTNLEPTEILSTELLTLKELKQEIASGNNIDGLIAAALFYLDIAENG